MRCGELFVRVRCSFVFVVRSIVERSLFVVRSLLCHCRCHGVTLVVVNTYKLRVNVVVLSRVVAAADHCSVEHWALMDSRDEFCVEPTQMMSSLCCCNPLLLSDDSFAHWALGIDH